jgi:hypothetical protein
MKCFVDEVSFSSLKLNPSVGKFETLVTPVTEVICSASDVGALELIASSSRSFPSSLDVDASEVSPWSYSSASVVIFKSVFGGFCNLASISFCLLSPSAPISFLPPPPTMVS